jgi:hypothetical protein
MTLAETYRTAYQTVLDRYLNENDKHGRSQKWKLQALSDDIRLDKNSSLVEGFVTEIEVLVDKMYLQHPVKRIIKSPKQSVGTTATKPVFPPKLN